MLGPAIKSRAELHHHSSNIPPEFATGACPGANQGFHFSGVLITEMELGCGASEVPLSLPFILLWYHFSLILSMSFGTVITIITKIHHGIFII